MIRSSLRLQKKEKVRSGIQRAPRRDYEKHRKFVRRFVCEGCGTSNNIQCAHLRLMTGGGEQLKPVDAWSYAACYQCHIIDQHNIGEPEWWRRIGKDAWKTCLKYALESPVDEVRQYARDVMIPLIDRFAEYDARIAALAIQEAA